MPGTTKAPEPLLSLAFVSHMCSRTALPKPPPWLFSSVAKAVCLWRKAQLCHLDIPAPSAAAAPGAVCGVAVPADTASLSLSPLCFQGARLGQVWPTCILVLGFSGFSLSGIKPLPSAMRIKIYWAFRPTVPGETADCCCCWELVPKCGLYKPTLTTRNKTMDKI